MTSSGFRNYGDRRHCVTRKYQKYIENTVLIMAGGFGKRGTSDKKKPKPMFQEQTDTRTYN